MRKKYISVNSALSVLKTSAGQRILGKWATIEARKSELETDLVRDAFYKYFLAQVGFVDEPHYSRKFNKKLLEWVTESEMFKLSQTRTMGRMFTSSRAAYALIEYLLNLPPIQQAMKDAQSAEQDEDEANDKKNGMTPQQRRQLREQAKQKYKSAEDKLESFTGDPDSIVAKVSAAAKANKQVEQALSAFSAWGLEDGSNSEMKMEDIEKILNTMNDSSLANLVERIGRAKGTAMQIKNRDDKPREEVVITDAGFTKDILSAFPTQQLALIDPTVSEWLHLKTLAEYGTHGVMGMIKSSEPVRMGTIVFKVDTSGSMNWNRLTLAKGLAIGLGRAAEKTGQTWLASNFGASHLEQSKPVGTGSTPVQILEFATRAYGGGTDFDASIRDGLSIIEKLEYPSQADLVMITDGEAGVHPATAKLLKDAKEKLGIRFMVLLVDTSSMAQQVKQVADYSALIRSASDIERAATGLAEAIWNK